MFGQSEDSTFTITFNRAGEIDYAPPADFDGADLPMMDHILSAVREAVAQFCQTPA